MMTDTGTTRRRTAATVATLAAMLLIACGDGSPGRTNRAAKTDHHSTGGETTMEFKLTSPAFENGKPIPEKHTGDGADVSPELRWTNVPPTAQELALICDDPDAPTTEPWVHWVIYKIPRDATGLPEGVPRREQLDQPPGSLQGVNSWPSDNVGYRGPKPPSGQHRYFFRLYALDKSLILPPKAGKEVVMRAMAGRIIAETQLMGTYRRKGL